MHTIEKLIRRHIQGKKVLLLFALTTVVYLTMILITIPKVMAYANGMPLLDMMPFGYDIAYVNDLFDALGIKGRAAYLSNQIPLDMTYPALFAISYCLILGFFLNKLNKLKTALVVGCLLPFVGGAMDYAENIGIIALLNNYPKLSDRTVTITSYFSLLKSMVTTLYFIILIGALVTLGIKTVKR